MSTELSMEYIIRGYQSRVSFNTWLCVPLVHMIHYLYCLTSCQWLHSSCFVFVMDPCIKLQMFFFSFGRLCNSFSWQMAFGLLQVGIHTYLSWIWYILWFLQLRRGSLHSYNERHIRLPRQPGTSKRSGWKVWYICFRRGKSMTCIFFKMIQMSTVVLV